jgi:hypothetical protein
MDIATADAYFETRLHSEAWEQASTSDKAKALATAEREIGTLQLHELTPGAVRNEAICEQAVWLLAATDYQRKLESDLARGLVSRSVGSASEQYTPRAAGRIPLAPLALALLDGWMQQYRMGELR